MIIGGVTLESDLGPQGHSDGDALCHAVTDALLGAAAMGDIGSLFPDTASEFKGADSVKLMGEAVRRLAAEGFEPWNVHSTVNLERTQLAPHRDLMRSNLASALGIPVDRVSVKATRGEGLGFVGRGEGIAAYSVASVVTIGESD